jgi:hypothetical protein
MRTTMNTTILLASACLLTLAPLSHAESVYKSVDADGNITYSSTPPAEAVDTVPVKLDQDVSAERKQQAAKLERQLEQSAKSATKDVERRRTKQASKIDQSEQSVERAKQALEQARIQQTDDWQGKAGGGRRLKPSYFERVEKAQAAVEAAEDDLSKTRRDAH